MPAAAFGPESESELTYAGRLLSVLDRTMLLLADADFDGAEFARDVQATGAQFLVRSSARRISTPFRHLGDGSYLARIGYGVLPALLVVRVIEASVTVTLADGTVRTEQWRLLTSLLDPAAHPATERRPRRPAPRPPPAPRQGPHPQEPHQQVRTERRTTPHDQPDLHRPHHRHVLRTRTREPLTDVNATVLTPVWFQDADL